jgi:hypothetical protein
VGRLFDLWEEAFKGVLRTFLDRARHEVHQLFECHFTLPAEILFSFFEWFSYSAFHMGQQTSPRQFFPHDTPYSALPRLGKAAYPLTCWQREISH